MEVTLLVDPPVEQALPKSTTMDERLDDSTDFS